MKKKKKKESSSSVGFSSTTLTDVLFILLLFFILISTIKIDSVRIKAAKVDKIKTESENPKKKQKHPLTLDQENNIYLDGKKLASIDELKKTLASIKSNLPEDMDPQIVLRADTASSSGKLIDILTALTEAGFADYVTFEVKME